MILKSKNWLQILIRIIKKLQREFGEWANEMNTLAGTRKTSKIRGICQIRAIRVKSYLKCLFEFISEYDFKPLCLR